MLRVSKGARRYNEPVTLLHQAAVVDEYGHAQMGDPTPIGYAYAYVRQMSAQKAMMTFQQGDIIGLDIEMRKPKAEFTAIEWRGHIVHFAQPEDVDMRGRIIRISGFYQKDDPKT